MYSSRDLRSRRYQPYPAQSERRIKPGWYILGGIALLLVLCCCCIGVVVLYNYRGALKIPSLPSLPSLPSTASATRTPTPDPDKPVGMRTRTPGDSGLEITVVNFQRPLAVRDLKNQTPDQHFVLVQIHIRNTKSTGAAVQIKASDFTMTGDGGLTYTANPPSIIIDNPPLLTQAAIPSGKETDASLIFKVAVDDANLRLIWASGGSDRIFNVQ